ncbi:Protein of unknown function DUF58 [Jatrophihabitans endophyticus]|uniref:DUF58 domain-containing protein n=1 Tax=Jatrophihabitans endophyticus TaxID=1206085 RepID=A0A1M5PG89_9ACTN|nr:DUF58 domain-containing protein [Jatrophihabitans endophyticus]SHH00772.1 Protein of unknown function DUF58 [Jatrophihabitans endophyticus]
MTPYGIAALVAGVASLVLGLVLDWLAFDLLGLGLLAAVLLGLATVVRPTPLSIGREIQPPRVPKGSPAIAFLTFANRSRRSHPVAVATQPFGSQRVRTVIPRLRGGESGTRAYRLPTTRRGIFDVPPLELTRRDPFELFRLSRHHAGTERIWVYPRVLGLRQLPVGRTRHLEGPSSDSSPQGNVTFHRLREYAEGDDVRLVHWRSSARAGRLLVRHNVDTSQPYTVVVFDQRPRLYTEESFEEAVDVAASVVVAAATDRAPVELRLTDGTVVGGPWLRDPTELVDELTGLSADADGSLQTVLTALRQTRGGTSLVVVTGALDAAGLPYLAGLRRRFERIVLVSLDPEQRGDGPVPHGVRVLVAKDADEAAAAWNLQVTA